MNDPRPCAEITGKEGLYFKGFAKVYDSEEAMLDALSKDSDSFKGSVIVIRYEGPKGGPGMPEMLTPTSAIMGAGLGQDCALITDGRFSGGSHGFVIGGGPSYPHRISIHSFVCVRKFNPLCRGFFLLSKDPTSYIKRMRRCVCVCE